jgi:hypothetical protein
VIEWFDGSVAAYVGDETKRRDGDHENFGPRRIGEREQSIARPRTRSPSVVGECSTLKIDERRLRHVVPEQHPIVSSAFTKVTVNVWSLQPYHLIPQAAVLTDPLADIRRVGAPQLLCVEGSGGPVETKICVGHHADVLTWNVAKDKGACGYARAHNPNLYSLRSKRGPLILIGTDEAAMIVGDVNRLRARPCEGQKNDKKELPNSH